MRSKALILTCVLSTSTYSFSVFSKVNIVSKVIYGIDDRMDVFECSDNLMKEISLSTAAQIYNSDITKIDGKYLIKEGTLEEFGICKTERFSSQPITANCSGFLIAPDVLVTAGHCILSKNDCKNHKWVFDYANKVGIEKKFSFTENQIYSCSSIIGRIKEDTTGIDYAVVKLNRKVLDRTPLKFRKEGKVSDDAELTVIGHPSGLPTKISSMGKVRNNKSENIFIINSDTFTGSSGSPVIDSKTGLVEGIIVRGDQDYKVDDVGCATVNVNTEESGRGEDALRVTLIKEIQSY